MGPDFFRSSHRLVHCYTDQFPVVHGGGVIRRAAPSLLKMESGSYDSGA